MASANSTDQTVYRWWVPLTYTSNFSDAQKSSWLAYEQSTMRINNVATRDQWVIFNVDEQGLYIHIGASVYSDSHHRWLLHIPFLIVYALHHLCVFVPRRLSYKMFVREIARCDYYYVTALALYCDVSFTAVKVTIESTTTPPTGG
jgi:hypothetical protein